LIADLFLFLMFPIEGVLPTVHRSSSEVETRRSSFSDEIHPRKSSLLASKAQCDNVGLQDVDYRLSNEHCDWEHSRSSGRSDFSRKNVVQNRTGQVTSLLHQDRVDSERNPTRHFKSRYSPR